MTGAEGSAGETGGPLGQRHAGIGILLILVTAVVSGVSTFVNFYAAHGTNTDAFVTVRNLMAAGLLIPVALVAGRLTSSPLRPRDWGRLAVIGLIGGAIPFLLFFRGIELATASGGAATATFGYRTLFLMASVFGIVVLREKFHARIALAAALLLAGNLLLLSVRSAIWSDGTGFVLVATVLWAAEYTLSKHTLRALPSTTVALGRMGFGAIFLVGYITATAQFSGVSSLSGAQWQWALVSALLLGAFVTSWYAGLKRVELGVATSVLVLGFPITTALAVGFGASTVTLLQAFGAAVVVAGAVLAVGAIYLRAAGALIVRAISPLPRPVA
ncbi:MAG: DMT family transporter [Thermoplasmata archaeon]|nr:DMT family transporter [Thermoplasmata archaeon]